MPKTVYLKGSKLFSLARKKALRLDLESKGLKLAELICKIQEREGNNSCFKQQEMCSQMTCCWQGSCGAKMRED